MIHISTSYSDSQTWYKGNLHTHTTFSDGTRDIEEVIADYDDRGYDFLGISDHDHYTDTSVYENKTRMVLIDAVEITEKGPHMLQVGAKRRLDPTQDRQSMISDAVEDGSLCFLNHPNWQQHFNHFDFEMMRGLDNYNGIEIYNGIVERKMGNPLATDKWDRLISKGKRVWGLANDDSHEPQDVGVAWNMVQGGDGSREQILTALREGAFYASTGVVIESICVAGLEIKITCSNANLIRFVGNYGTVYQTSSGAEASFEVPNSTERAKDIKYLRAECIGEGGKTAWTQPFFLET